MPFTPNGNHLIAGTWVSAPDRFTSRPAHGPSHSYSVGRAADVAAAAEAAEAAFASYSALPAAARADFLDTIAAEIEARAAEITEIGTQETGLPAARLEGERGRTTGQLRLFASHIRAGAHLDARHDPALPDRAPLPRPDLRLMQRPVGPVAVFGASNFPLAFSVAGGDTAAALAAGCPVIVKGHSAHPGTGEIVAEAVLAALTACGIAPGVFSLIQGGDRSVGAALVQHPRIKAVGFTGSLTGGRALFDLCAARPEPIPFFGELGSVNPMVVLPGALHARGAEIATGWAASLTLGAGQFCTNPGLALLPAGAGAEAEAEAFAATTRTALAQTGAQVMLTEGIAAAYRHEQQHLAAIEGVECLLQAENPPRQARPALYRTSARQWLENPALQEEVFGPLGLIVTCEDAAERLAVACALQGQLTCTLQMEESDLPEARALMPVLERKAGRVLANGFPTGVEVCDAMVHGGPYPASTNFGATSVGTLSIRRFLRPVCYQDIPAALLPQA
ncbi:aldehyde dehydrogenase (NADP(+)) [Pseudoruegeria sp. SHC-113]|uniref:aldehyde dehydrogenase (NADP(+)) n=1 Tax=Pseudoruegeria sp. SHC-113 TaxID=2855439 RepID=UPI0021BBB665|nr:aldehyde dehydrogenase (NADP(+)) [Pseudoruegeria sp. SHC-113]MCT8162077.1 aldehyde dehydrogenase (NADP(+)) [Pseudoruegeria sp. SHC-113]